jgi:hypothetical protein
MAADHEYVEFIKNELFAHLRAVLEVHRNSGTESEVMFCNQKLGDDLKKLESMFGSKVQQIRESFERLEAIKHECSVYKKKIRDLEQELERKCAVDEPTLDYNSSEECGPECPIPWYYIRGLQSEWKKECEETPNSDQDLERQLRLTESLERLAADYKTFYVLKNITLEEDPKITTRSDTDSFF